MRRGCLNMNERVLNKYIKQFQMHWSNPISELYYDFISSQFRSHTKDMLCFTLDIEFMKYRDRGSEKQYQRLILQSSQLFELQFKTECLIPISILSGTESIFYQRKRKLRKLMYQELSSELNTTIFQLSQSSSSQERKRMPPSILRYKDSEQLNQMNEESSLQYSLSSSYNIFHPSTLSQPNESQISLTLKLNKLSTKDEELKDSLGHAYLHLIFDYKIISLTDKTFLKPRNVIMNGHRKAVQDSNVTKESKKQKIDEEIQSIIHAEMNKFKVIYKSQKSLIESVSSSMINKRKIREKAEQFLKNIDYIL